MVCNICGTPQQLAYTKHNYPIMRCPQCGLGATQIDNSEAILDLYDESYFQGGQSDGYADYLGSEQALRAEFRRALNAMRQYAPDSGNLLEIGCAYGFFMMEAASHYTCTGLEVSESAVEYCRSHGLDVHCDTVNAETIHNYGSFEAVVMLDVIEHLPDPGETIRLLSSVMTSGACLMLTTGDWGTLLARLTGKNWRLMTPPQHLYFFTRASITRLLNDNGLEVIKFEHPWKHVPLGLAMYQLRRAGLPLPTSKSLNQLALPVNLFDAMRVIARKK